MAVGEAVVPRIGLEPRRVRSPWMDALYQLTRNKLAVASGIFILFVVLVAVLAKPITDLLPGCESITPTTPCYAAVHFGDAYDTPGVAYPAGADKLGRDMLARTIYGARVSMSVAFVAATISLLLGISYGLTAGYLGGRIDNLMMRLVDFLYGFPALIFIILLQVYFKAVSRERGLTGVMAWMVRIDRELGGLFFLFIAIGFFTWLGMARIARGQTLSYARKEFVEAARAVGAGDVRIMSRHLLPNILGPCIVQETLAIPGYIITEAFISFLGLGVNPPTPSWGIMIAEGYVGIRSNLHLILAPSIALALTVLAFNFFGDGLRDALDPRLRGEA